MIRNLSSTRPNAARPLRVLTGLLLGLALALLLPSETLTWPARATAGVALATAWCWLTLAMPLGVTALLPAVFLPLSGAVPSVELAPHYFHDILFLFLGGFLLARALERHGLHRRFALWTVALLGTTPTRVVLGFLIAAAILSMAVSNTATVLMMLPIALAVLSACSEGTRSRLAAPLLLSTAYGASVGGMATPIGTPPNLMLLGQWADRFPEMEVVSFGSWLFAIAPLSLLLLLVIWALLTRILFRLPQGGDPGLAALRAEAAEQPPLNRTQRSVVVLFLVVALLWLTRTGFDFGKIGIPGWQALLPTPMAHFATDATVALAGAILLFLLPDRVGEGSLLELEDLRSSPWDILLLLGGGLALASAFQSSGLSGTVGDWLGSLASGIATWQLILIVALTVTFLTEVTSNTATITVLLPILFESARAAGLHPLLLALPATLSASCAFMLPVATPPNAIIFSSGELTVPEMARAGILLNLIGAVLITLAVQFLIAPAWGISL